MQINNIKELEHFVGKWFIYIVGLRGTGKTTLMAHILCMMMIPPYCLDDLRRIAKEIKDMQCEGWDNLSLDPEVQHAVYVVEDVFTAKNMGYEPRVSMELDFDRLGLCDGVKEVDYLLPFAKIGIPELQGKVDSRKSMTADGVADNLLRYIERQRKVEVQMFADTQIFDSVDKRFRSMADCVLAPKKFKHTRERTTWDCLMFDNIKAYERWENTGKTNEATRVKFVHIGNIFDCVDSHAGKERFYYGMGKRNYHTKSAEPMSNSKQKMMERCEKFPLFKSKKEKESS